MRGEDSLNFVISAVRNKSKRKEGESEEEEDEEDDSEDQGDDDEEEDEESVGNKRKKAEMYDEEVSKSMMPSVEPAADSVFVIVNVSCSTSLTLMRSFHIG